MSARIATLPVLVLVVGLAASPATAGVVGRASVSSSGGQSTSNSFGSSGRAISADGRFVVFQSASAALVPGDTNAFADVFLRDRSAGTTVRVSVASDGTQANQSSNRQAISADGAVVAWDSAATNLVPGETGIASDVFVRDLVTGQTTRVSVSSTGEQGDRNTFSPSLSADGQTVSFESQATNLVPGDINGFSDVFVHDRATGTTSRVSVGPGGVQANQASMRAMVSGDGSVVVFESVASNLVPGDTNGATDVFVHDRTTGTTSRMSVASDGTQANAASARAAVSADGRFVAFESAASNLVPGDTNNASDVFVHDRLSGETVRASVSSAGAQGGAASVIASLSDDGRFVAFESTASNLVTGDTNIKVDVFVRDLTRGLTMRVSLPPSPMQSNADSVGAAISADGRALAFESIATNLVTGDTNGVRDVFVWTALCGDGRLDPTDDCDDGNLVSGDGCDANCTATGCGNGVVTAGEGCDDGNVASGDGCDVNCTPTGCGNGVITAGEQCDDGNGDDLDGCRNDCVLPFCGDGLLDPGELCDDGNTVSGDGCDEGCTLTGCGNGVVTGGEACDDGNPTEGDGCDSNCTLTACGNGVVTAGEGCDDGNPSEGDGCDTNCTPTACGNGVVSAGEACDDGNPTSGDGCDGNCTLTGCGNGMVTAGEACDDGNTVSGDGCDGNCTPTGCGNGILTAGEACDDGNTVDGDGCDSTCTATACGNGVVTGSESCDDGNTASGDGCDANCTPTGCGNGIVTAGEGCDDGNTVSGDGCDANCTPTGCGNGIVTTGEGCDDGNTVPGDGCSATCTVEGNSGPLCAAGMQVENASVVVRTFGRGAIDERLVVRGRLKVDRQSPITLAPETTGVQLRIEDLGGQQQRLIDLTSATMPIPPGRPGTQCHRLEGWWVSLFGRVHWWRNRSGALAPACDRGSAQGLRYLEFVDRRERRQGQSIDFRAAVRGPVFDGLKGPLRVTVVLGTTPAASAGQCGTFTTKRCTSDRWRLNLICQ